MKIAKGICVLDIDLVDQNVFEAKAKVFDFHEIFDRNFKGIVVFNKSIESV